MRNLSVMRYVGISVIVLSSLFGHAQQITQPREPSPAASVTQKIGISTIVVNYSRPAVKGREIWGKLVPYGWNKQGFGTNLDAPWRAGANENTVLTISHDATIEGHQVPAGSYGLFFVINKDNSGEVILSKEYKSWGSFWYDPKFDEMRSNITIRDLPNSVERLNYELNITDKNSAELVLNWEKKQFPIKIEFKVDDIVMSNAVEELKGPIGFGWQGYNSAAAYALANKTNLTQGLAWADQAIAMTPNFTDLTTKAGILNLQGKNSEADQVLLDARARATEFELNNYGYQLLGNQQYDKAIEVLALNTKKYPESANTWDSLGEAYALKGDKKNAIANFKKSLSLNPTPATKANSEKYMKQLGAM
jgi:tetratricopeptide (TPR) repeat protein